MVKAFPQTVEQAAGRIGIAWLQPTGDLPKLSQAFFLAELPGRPHQLARLPWLIAGQTGEHVT